MSAGASERRHVAAPQGAIDRSERCGSDSAVPALTSCLNHRSGSSETHSLGFKVRSGAPPDRPAGVCCRGGGKRGW